MKVAPWRRSRIVTTEQIEVACTERHYHHLDWEIPIADGLCLVERVPVTIHELGESYDLGLSALVVRSLGEAEKFGLEPCIVCLRVASFEEVQE